MWYMIMHSVMKYVSLRIEIQEMFTAELAKHKICDKNNGFFSVYVLYYVWMLISVIINSDFYVDFIRFMFLCRRPPGHSMHLAHLSIHLFVSCMCL